jgi:hypothetical protein
MSVEELIDLAKGLTPEEQTRLVQAGEMDRLAKLERQFAEMFPPGTVIELQWPTYVDVSEEVLLKVLEELRTA